MLGWIIGAVLLIWLLLSVRRVGPTELGVKVIMGNPIAFCEPGPHFIPWFFRWNYLIRVSSGQYKVAIPPVQAYTKATKVGEGYGSQPLTVDSTVYLSFPRDGRLIEVVRAKVPTTEAELSEYLKDAVREAVRIAVGKHVWKTATQNLKKIKDEADRIFHDPESPLVKAGFKEGEFRLVIEEVRVPAKLEALMSQPEEERFKSRAMEHTTDTQAEQTMGLVMKLRAKARGKTPEEIQREIDSDPQLRKEVYRFGDKLTERLIAYIYNARTEVGVDGAEGFDKSLLQAIALFKKLSGGGFPQQPGEREKKEEEGNFPLDDKEKDALKDWGIFR